MRKLNIIELMGGMGIATQACKNNAGENNVQVETYIDNNINSVRVYNEFFDTKFDSVDINCFDFNTIKQDVDIVFVSFPSNTFRDRTLDKPIQYKMNILFDAFLRRNTTDDSVIDCIKTTLPKCVVVDYTFVSKKCKVPKSTYTHCMDLKNIEQCNFYNFLKKIENIGYNVFCNTYNAACFNTPQNRERISVVCFRRDIGNNGFKFPIGKRTNKVLGDYKLKDYLDRYVLTPEQICIINDSKSGKRTGKQVKYTNRYVHDNDLITFISASYGFNRGWSPIVECDKGSGWRLLMPLEVFRFMGLTDSFYYFVSSIVKDDTSLYELGGNSMIGTYYNDLLKNILNIKAFRCWE